MKKLLAQIACSFLMFGLSFSVSADEEKGTAQEAVAMVKKAVAYVKTHGKEKALAKFNEPKSEFTEKDLYIFVADYNGINLASPVNPKLVGKDLFNLKDVNGKLYVQELIEKSKKGGGWVDYAWPHPVTKAVMNKSSYVEGVEGMFLGCGIYKQ